jgi:3-oxoacyl-(acyl-carrier-protein) synthase
MQVVRTVPFQRNRVWPVDRDDPVVITGIGLLASVGHDRESVWQAVQQGRSGVRPLVGLEGIPDGSLIGAQVDLAPDPSGRLKVITMALQAADEAMRDARVDLDAVDRNRFGCSVSAHVGDTTGVTIHLGLRERDPRLLPWWEQWLPNTASAVVANRYGLRGPRLAHSTACASGLVEVLMAARSLQHGQCDMALVGSSEAINPIFAAGFDRMKVLARHEDPTQACRPFDANRSGFVMGEGAGMFVLERLRHALDRGARIYAQITAAKMLSEAFHVTGLDEESEALGHLITLALREARLAPDDISYINAHGTGTQQNDVGETRGIRRAFGRAADSVCVSSIKSMLGHLVNASGSVELGLTALALRDGFTPPTINLTDPDPECNLDCIPLVGRPRRFDHALKLSVAFGGHLVAMTLRRWNDAAAGFEYPTRAAA